MKVLVTGMSGLFGRLVTRELIREGHDVVGIDRRPWPEAPSAARLFQIDVRKRPAEEVFRHERPEAVVHLATLTHQEEATSERSRINLGGTRAVLEHCSTYGVRQFVFVGRHTYYGATSESALYHTEDEPPLGIETYPELADLVAADLFAGAALWRYAELCTGVLRICYTLGPTRQGTLGSYLSAARVPVVLGFDPLFQFMHQDDAARAIVMAVDKKLRGVFNVAGPPPLPLREVIRGARRHAFPVVEGLYPLFAGRFGFPKLARGALAHLKYPIVVDAAAFRAATGFVPAHDNYATLEDFAGS